jgi:hypothetical protein
VVNISTNLYNNKKRQNVPEGVYMWLVQLLVQLLVQILQQIATISVKSL